MASFITKGLSVLKKQPIGCFLASIISLGLISAAIAGMFFVAVAIVSIPILKEAISSQTGFHASTESMFMNAFTGKCEINYLTLQNPNAYNVSGVLKDPEMESETFLEAKKVLITISPYELFANGRFVIKSLELDLNTINCIRINSASYNLPEFLTRFAKISQIEESDGKPFLEKFSLRISRGTYYDVTTISDIMKWNNTINFQFAKNNITDVNQLVNSVAEALTAANAPYLARGLTIGE